MRHRLTILRFALRAPFVLIGFQFFLFGQISTTVSLSSSPNPAIYGQAVTLQANVTTGATGKVTFYDGTTVLGIAAVSGSTATLKTTLLASGTRMLRAYYSGNATYGPSTSIVVPQTVNAGASLGFYPAVTYATSSIPVVTVVGDFNGDGKQDLAVATSNSANGGIDVLLGNGDGTFQSAVTYSPNVAFVSIVAGDFNGDGKTDLAAATNSTTISVLLGNGDGTFQAPTNVPVGAYPISMVTGDFNGDGKIDLAVALSSSTIGILLGNGDATFQTDVTYPLSGSAQSPIEVGDFNGDGKTDLVVAVTCGGAEAIDMLLGVGDGTFGAAAVLSPGVYCDSIVVADFNGDGKADLAGSGSYQLAVLLGNGDGTFQPATKYIAEYSAGPLVAGDFNGDGKVDLATADRFETSANSLAVLLGNGNGSFQPAVFYPFLEQYEALATGDFNGDGIVDLVASGQPSNVIGVNVFLGGNSPRLSIGLQRVSGFTQGQVEAYVVTVTNSGGVPTLGSIGINMSLPAGLTAMSISGSGWGCTLSRLACARSDSLTAGASYPVIEIKFAVSATLTGNVTTSVTASGGGSPSLSSNTATDTTPVRLSTSTQLSVSPTPGVLGSAVTLTATVTSGATGKVAFYDGAAFLGVAPLLNGRAAFVTYLLPVGARSLRARYIGASTYGPSLSSLSTETVSEAPLNGVLPATSYKLVLPPSSVLLGVGDFNGDGIQDLVETTQSGISVQLGRGSGVFQTAAAYQVALANPNGPIGLVVGDFNGDGHQDIAISDESGIYVLLGNGDGTFQPAVTYTLTFSSPYITAGGPLVSGDFNGDGQQDLALTAGGNPIVLLGNGDGTFQPFVTIPNNGVSHLGLAVADLNGDGIPDLLGLNAVYNSQVEVFLGNGDGTFQAPVNYSDASMIYAVGFCAGDFNGDGKIDIAVVSGSGVTVFPGNGDGTLRGAVATQLGFNPGGSVLAGDFNGDGKLDIAYAASAVNQVYIVFGNGDGTFQYSGFGSGVALPIDAADITGGIAIVAGDFNGDGRPDLAAGNPNTSTVDVFLGAQSSGLRLSLSHTGNFTIGQTGTYQANVGNPEYAATSGSVAFKDTLPSGLTALSINGSGWFCTLSNLTCTISLPLGPDASCPPISIQVSVAANLPAGILSNSASVTYSGVVNGAIDSTYIAGTTTTTLTASSGPYILEQTVTLNATVTSGATGKVEFSDGGAVLGSAALINGHGVLATRFLETGSHLLVAAYLGDTSHAGSTSAVRLLAVNANPVDELSAPVAYNTGASPAAVAIGDFNGDGKPDLATANSGSNSVSVLLGNGDGTYRPRVDYAVGKGPAAVIVGDFNNDGKADLAVVNYSANSISVLLGNGDGTFQAAATLLTSYEPSTLATADFNGDGKADLIMGDGTTLGLFLGNGDGTFQAQTIINSTGGVIAFSIGDFNGDGKPDIACTGALDSSILLGNGDGTFQAANFSSQTGEALAIGDLNRDGVADIVVAESYFVSIYLGNGDGTFQAPATYQTGCYAHSIVVTDWNGDGNPDIICTNSTGGSIILFLGNGDGTLSTTAASYAVGTQPQSIAVGDFNNDGRTDAAVANLGSNNVSVILGLFVPGSVSQTITFDPIPKQIFGVSPFPIMARASSGLPIGIVSTTSAVCQVADSLVMLLSVGTCSITASQAGNASYNAATPVTRGFTVGQAAPSGSFAAAAGSPFTVGTAGTEPFSVIGGDFNGDGDRDLAIANNTGTVAVLLGNGAGGFMAATGSPFAVGNNSFSVAAGDFNADGALDLAATSESPSNVTVLLGNGASGFAAATGSPFPAGVNPDSVAVGDFNGDGIPDLVTADFSGTVAVLLGNGSGGFTAAAGSPFTAGVNLTSVAVGDFNGDGIQDLVVTDSYSNSVTVLLGNGWGGFKAAGSPITVQYAPFSVAVGDFNGDGIQDLAIANLNSNSVTVLLGNGAGGFTAAPGSPFSVGSAPYSVVVGDFNGDGIQDLATANSGSNNVTVLLGNGSGGFTAAVGSPYAVGSTPHSLTVGDLNGDGIEDLAIANSGSGNVTALLGVVAGHTSQTITFGAQGNVAYGISPFTIGATSSSGLAVSFASTTPAVCTVTGATVTIAGGGLCTIVASQLGNATYAAATVSQSFTVTMQYSPCDLKQTGSVTVVDVQLIINEALGVAPPVNFLAGNSVVNVVDVQIEINAALGLGCAAR